MKIQIFTILLATILLTACTPNESEFKSDVPVNNPPTKIITELPTAFNLDIQFHPQAPTGNWDMPYQEACEEASLILAHNYMTDKKMSTEEFNQAIIDMVNWQVEKYGKHKDLTIKEVAEIAEEYLGYQDIEIIENPTIEQIRTHLAAGHPIVAPSAGRELGNPFFTGEGPIYHMLVIRGYEGADATNPKDRKFITNDVGTRRGENFTYDEETLLNALHDWVDGSKANPELIKNGQRKILILK